MVRSAQSRREENGQAGISLLEVLMAVSILGICFTAVFSAFSVALGAADRLERHNQAVTLASQKLNELMLDPALSSGQEKSGVAEPGLRWRATTELAGERPGPLPDQRVQLVRVRVEVSWEWRSRRQDFSLESLTLRVPEAEATP